MELGLFHAGRRTKFAPVSREKDKTLSSQIFLYILSILLHLS